MRVKSTRKQVLDKMDEMFERKGRQCRKYTDNKTQQQDELILRHMLLAPVDKAVEQAYIFITVIHHSLMTVTVPFAVSLIMPDDFALPISSCL